MHEMAIANSVMTSIRTEVARHPGAQARKVGLRIGELAAIDPDALEFCFRAMTRETDLESLEMAIEVCPRRHRCNACQTEFAIKDYDFACPKCGGMASECISGDELEMVYLEVEET